MSVILLQSNDSISVKDKASLITTNENLSWFLIIGVLVLLVVYWIVKKWGGKEAYKEVGKSLVNLSIGVYLVGIIQPFLSSNYVSKTTFVLTISTFVIFILVGVYFINKGSGNYRTQDVADAQTVHAFEGRRSCGDVKMKKPIKD